MPRVQVRVLIYVHKKHFIGFTMTDYLIHSINSKTINTSIDLLLSLCPRKPRKCPNDLVSSNVETRIPNYKNLIETNAVNLNLKIRGEVV